MPGLPDDLPDALGDDSVTVIPDTADVDPPTEARSVLVLSPHFMATYALPRAEEVVIGRSSSVEIYVDDPQVSRRHAALAGGARPTVRDLGSSNGTRVHGTPLPPGAIRELAVGDVVMVGSVALLIQRGAATVSPRRFWTTEQLEHRLKEECARAERTGTRFCVACLEVDRHVPEVGVRQALAAALHPSDIVGERGRSGYAIVLAEASPDKASAVLERIAGELASRDVVARWGLAEFPGGGRTGEELLAGARPAAEVARAPLEITGGRVIADAVTLELYRMAERIAAGDISVLIVGETGVGKEVMAEEIHRRSPRASKPFVRINCGALSEFLLDSELFGHERGAFTHAVAAKPGLLETADSGVVLLDEIGEMPINLQVKLLRVIEEKQMRRVGGVKPRPLDVRFIAATNRDLEQHAERGLFRQDLYYRLAGATLAIPPLRDRPADIEPLARTFLRHASRHLGVPATISPQALAVLRAHRWPGNIRELRHVIERAVLLAGTSPIAPAHLALDKGPAELQADDRTRVVPRLEPTALTERVAPIAIADEDDADDRDRRAVLEVLAACGGNQSRAAKQLGISRGALIRRLERYGVARPRKSDSMS